MVGFAARLRSEYAIARRHVPERQPGVLAKADLARFQRDWPNAARLYQTVCAQQPNRTDLHVQLGNCLKEANEFTRAYAAYSKAVSIEETADCELQLGHLFKVTGNLAGARQHYLRAVTFGSPEAAAELISLPHMLMEAMWGLLPERYDSDAGTGPDVDLLRLVRSLSWCEQQFDDTRRQHELAYELKAAGFPQFARAAFEMAFLREGFSPDRLRERAWIALQTGLWDEAGVCAPRSGATAARVDAVAGLRRVVRLAADDPGFAPVQQSLEVLLRRRMPTFDDAEHLPPKAAQPVASEDFSRLAGLISRLLQSLSEPPAQQDSTELAAVLEEVSETARQAAPAISFGYTSESVPAHMARMLTNNLSHFMRARHHLVRGPFGSTHAFQFASRVGELAPGAYFSHTASLVAPENQFLEGLGVEVAAVTGATSEMPGYRDLVERVAVLLGHTLEIGALERLVHCLLDAHFSMAAVVLIDEAASRGDDVHDLLRHASIALKHAGLCNLSLKLQRRLARSYPDEPAIVMELGIQEKIAGNFDEAVAAFRRCLVLSPNDQVAWRELLAVASEVEPAKDIALLAGDSAEARELAQNDIRYRLHLEPWRYVEGRAVNFDDLELRALAPEIAPELNLLAPPQPLGDRIEVRQIGWERRHTHLGEVPVLRGVEAIRVYCYSSTSIAALRIRIDGRTVRHLRGHGVPVPGSMPPQQKYVFNAWIDLSEISLGFHEIQFYFEESTSGYRPHCELMIVDQPRADEAHALSDAVIPHDLAMTALPLDDSINAAPSMIRPAGRSLFGRMPRKVLIVRTDQLGDFVASIPAILRLRTFLPEADLTGLVTPTNEALARSLGVFSTVIRADLTYDHLTKRRYMPLAAQIALRKSCKEAAFDLAIDLCPGADSRPLLRLSGARHLVGFRPREFPWLTFGIDTVTRDSVNGKEHVPHAALILSLVEALGAMLVHRAVTIPNPAGRDGLERFGVGAGDRYLLLHAGARLLIKRWPTSHYLLLAQLLLAHTSMKVVMLADEALSEADATTANALDNTRFHLTVGHVGFLELEMLIGHCSAFVGNDTGPKHLAALRGAKVVSVHMGQVNWDEWGQEGDGYIVSRRIPCCGCGIEDAEDCGKDLACLVNIRPEEVFAAVQRLL